MATQKALIAEPNPLLYAVLAGILELSGFSVVGQVADRSGVVFAANGTRPDILLFGFPPSLYGKEKFSEIIEIKEQLPGIKIIFMDYGEVCTEFAEDLFSKGFDAVWNKFDTEVGFRKALSTLDE